MAIDGGLTGIWTRVPLLRADTVNLGKMGQSLLLVVANGPRCWLFLLGSIQLLSGWSRSITGMGSSNWLESCGCLIRLEWIDLSALAIGAVCCICSIRALISPSWSSCRCCWITFSWGWWLNVPPALCVWFQLWKSIRNPLLFAPPADSLAGRKASGSLNKSVMTLGTRSGSLDEGYSTDWAFDWTPFFYTLLLQRA